MILDQALINALKQYFISKDSASSLGDNLVPQADKSVSLGSEAAPFSTIYAAELVVGQVTTTQSSGTPQMAGNYEIVESPKARSILVLDASAKFPPEVYPAALPNTGGTLHGNVILETGVKIGGVDIPRLYADFFDHINKGLIAAHGYVGPHNHLTDPQGGDLLQYPSAELYGTRSAHNANRLNRYINVGAGMLGGGLLTSDITIRINPGPGVVINQATNQVTLGTIYPITALSASTADEKGHGHAVSASSNPYGESLLKSNPKGGLQLVSLTVGSGTLADKGLRVYGQSTFDAVKVTGEAIVDGRLKANSTFTVNSGYATINADAAQLLGALTVKSADISQRGLVVHAITGQTNLVPVISTADANGVETFAVLPDGTLQSRNPNFVSGLVGWRITGQGDAEFRNITARGELHTSIFTKNEIHASGGSVMILPAATTRPAVLASDNLIGTTFNLIVAADPSTPGACPFSVKDVIRAKFLSGTKE